MTTTPSVSPSLSLSPLHSEWAFPFPRSSPRSRAGVAFPARPYGPLLRRRTPAMSAGGVGVNGSPVAPEDYAGYFCAIDLISPISALLQPHDKICAYDTGIANCSTGISFLHHMLD
uniref:Uncharacterized protein n=1 Tax=Triticum urartu TaxID=4572 RepID=A0A8R7TD19_TRIUA